LFTLKHAATAPLLRIDEAKAEALGANLYKITAVVANHGYLPTNMTVRAVEHGTAGTTTAALSLSEGIELVMGTATQDLRHLAGRDERKATWSPWLPNWGATKRKVEWLVRAPSGGSVTVTAGAPRAGRKQIEVKL
jgi:hypothetical protein